MVAFTFSVLGLRSEADGVFVVAERAKNKTLDANERVSNIERGVLSVTDVINQTKENVESATQALEDAESKCE